MTALALEGGGALAAAHAGVLRAMDEEGLRPGAVGGTSAGAVVAAAYALRGEYGDVALLLAQAQALGNRLLDVNLRGLASGALQLLLRKNFRTMGLLKGDRLYTWMNDFTQGASLTEAALPIVIPAVDLLSGNVVAFASRRAAHPGDTTWDTNATIATAVRASCSLPIAFVPHMEGGRMLVDGGVLENLPVQALLALGARKVLGVQVSAESEGAPPPDDVVGIGIQTLRVMQRRLLLYEENAAAALLRVILPKGSGIFSLDRLEEYAQYGYEAALYAMPRLRRFFRANQ